MRSVVFDSSGNAIHSQGQSATRMDSRCSCDSRTCVDTAAGTANVTVKSDETSTERAGQLEAAVAAALRGFGT